MDRQNSLNIFIFFQTIIFETLRPSEHPAAMIIFNEFNRKKDLDLSVQQEWGYQGSAPRAKVKTKDIQKDRDLIVRQRHIKKTRSKRYT